MTDCINGSLQMGHLGWFQYLNNSFLQGMQAKWGGTDHLGFCAIF